MAKCFAECVESFVHVVPATVLEVHWLGGEATTLIDVPEKRFNYNAGDCVPFGSKKARNAFVKAHGDKFRAFDGYKD